MNERIQELYTSVVGNDKLNFDSYLAEKFAELIVRECIREIGFKSVELLDIDFYPHYQERLRKHFGVEE